MFQEITVSWLLVELDGAASSSTDPSSVGDFPQYAWCKVKLVRSVWVDFDSVAGEFIPWSEGVSICVWTDSGDSVWVDWSRVDLSDVCCALFSCFDLADLFLVCLDWSSTLTLEHRESVVFWHAGLCLRLFFFFFPVFPLTLNSTGLEGFPLVPTGGSPEQVWLSKWCHQKHILHMYLVRPQYRPNTALKVYLGLKES